jgi:hypothetical protein
MLITSVKTLPAGSIVLYALHEGVDTAWGIDGSVGTAGVQEALKVTAAVLIISGNLS